MACESARCDTPSRFATLPERVFDASTRAGRRWMPCRFFACLAMVQRNPVTGEETVGRRAHSLATLAAIGLRFESKSHSEYQLSKR